MSDHDPRVDPASAPPSKRFDLSRRVTFVAIGQALAKASQLVIGAVLVRILSGDDWKRMALLLSVYQASVGIGSLNIHQSIYFFFGRLPRSEWRSFVLQNVGLLACSAVVTAGIVLGLAAPVGGGAFHIEHLIPWLALAALFEIPTAGIAELYIAADKPARGASAQAALSILQVLAVCLPVAISGDLDAGIYGLLGYVALRVAFFVMLVRTLTEPLPPSPHRRTWADIPWARVREQLVYVLPLAMTISASYLNRFVDKWLMAALRPEDYGTYVLAGTEVPLVSVFSGAVGAVLAIRLVRGFQEKRTEYARAIFRAGASRMSLLVLPISMAVIVAAPELLGLLFTPAYVAAAPAFQIISIILLHRVAEYGVVLRAAGDTRALWWASLVLLTGNALFSLIGIVTLGMVGSALGTLAASGIAWWFALLRIGRVMHRPIRDIFPWRFYLTVLATATASGVVAWCAAIPVTGAIPSLVVKLAVFALCYLGAARALGLRARLPAVPDDAPEQAP